MSRIVLLPDDGKRASGLTTAPMGGERIYHWSDPTPPRLPTWFYGCRIDSSGRRRRKAAEAACDRATLNARRLARGVWSGVQAMIGVVSSSPSLGASRAFKHTREGCSIRVWRNDERGEHEVTAAELPFTDDICGGGGGACLRADIGSGWAAR